jgi:hypothetical protein
MSVAQGLQGLGLVLAALAALASVAALIVRFRRSRGVERRQLQWFTFAGAIEVTAIAVTPFLDLGTATGPVNVVVAIIVAPLVPIAAAIAILRYRLYEIDRIVSRTVAYAILTAVLVAVYAGAVLAIQAFVAPVAQQDGPVAVAASTLIVASLFQPLRRRIQAIVDRRFNRARYDAQQSVDAFAGRIRDEVDSDRLAEEVAGVVQRDLEPSRLGIWIRETAR